ncbi:MAG TPA: 6-bladed beta-propeller [Longimicrobium sp.]|uniref:6-bladed beta-propeller n=1 Tax=Longimicrobium sp. TaxID=2029185 RepID=UPI002EDB6FE3
MKRRAAWIVAAALGVVALCLGVAEARARAQVRRELSSPLFAAPVDLAPARERVLPRSDAPRPLPMRPVLRIDGGDGLAPPFGRLADVAPSRSGDTLYVLDEMEARVSAFGRDGRFLFAFGRKGRGPGEFLRPTHLLVLPWSGAVGVWDADAQRLTLHAPDGARPRVANPAAGHRTTASKTVRRLAAFDGGFVMEVHADPLLVGPDGQAGALVRLDTALAAADTLVRFAVAGVRATHVETAAGSSATTWLNPPVFSPAPSWDLLRDGTVVFAPGGPAEAYRIGAGGAARVRWARAPGRVTRQDRLRRLAGEIDTGLMRVPPVPPTVLEALHRRFFAHVRPAVTGVLATPGGEVWARRFDTEASWEGHARTWDRAGWDGSARTPVRVPPRFRPLRISGSHVYGIAFDDTYVDRVEVYPLSEAGAE